MTHSLRIQVLRLLSSFPQDLRGHLAMVTLCSGRLQSHHLITIRLYPCRYLGRGTLQKTFRHLPPRHPYDSSPLTNCRLPPFSTQHKRPYPVNALYNLPLPIVAHSRFLCQALPATPSGEEASFKAKSSPPTVPTSEDPPGHTIQPPVQLPIAPDEFAALLRTAVLECQSHNETEIPKTFADFILWLQQRNEAYSSGALLRTPP